MVPVAFGSAWEFPLRERWHKTNGTLSGIASGGNQPLADTEVGVDGLGEPPSHKPRPEPQTGGASGSGDSYVKAGGRLPRRPTGRTQLWISLAARKSHHLTLRSRTLPLRRSCVGQTTRNQASTRDPRGSDMSLRQKPLTPSTASSGILPSIASTGKSRTTHPHQEDGESSSVLMTRHTGPSGTQ